MAQFHIPGFLAAGAEVVAVADTNPAAAEKAGARYGIKRLFHDAAEMFSAIPDIDAVSVILPNKFHMPLAIQALQAGKHVFVEKPLSLTQGDGATLVRLAAERQKTLFVGHILHYHAAVVRLKEMIKAGEIGRLQYIYSRRLSLGKIRREENILWSFAPHDISLILSLRARSLPMSIPWAAISFMPALPMSP